MSKFLIIFLAFIIFLVSSLRFTIVLMGRIVGKYIYKKHKATEEISMQVMFLMVGLISGIGK